jgi:uncharacterized protein
MAMPERNLELVRRSFDAIRRKDLDTLLDLADPEVVFVNPDYAVETGTRVGHEGIRIVFDAMFDAFEELRFEPTELIDLGDRVVAIGRMVAKAKGSGVGVNQSFGQTLGVREGKLTRVEWFNDADQAMAAAGVAEANVQRVREGFAAMQRGDVEALVALVHPNVAFVNPEYAIESGTRHGPDGYQIAILAMFDIFEDFEFATLELVDLDDRVLVRGRVVARAKGSGVPLDQPFGHVLTFEDGKLIRHEWYRTPEEAEAVAGLARRSVEHR